jgi:hypothetical protein
MDIHSGYFFITDITGYTMFLTGSELDHAKDILDSLFAAILRHIQPPLIVHGTRGDAIVAYTPGDSFLNPRTLLDTAEELYFDFRRQLDIMAYRTTCTCRACANMRQLDLKVFLHYGQYMLQKIGDVVDLQGADVILIHRLMKNHVHERTGLTGYALPTEAAIQAMHAEQAAAAMLPHEEEYEHLGRVHLRILDLQRAWDEKRARRPVIVPPEDAWAYAAVEVPVDPWIAWDQLLDQDNKIQFQGLLDETQVDPPGGRTGAGSVFHCRHELGNLDHVIVDWDPPRHLTTDTAAFGMIRSLVTWRLTPTRAGTRVEFITASPHEGDGPALQPAFRENAEATARAYAQIIEEGLRTGGIKQPAAGGPQPMADGG